MRFEDEIDLSLRGAESRVFFRGIDDNHDVVRRPSAGLGGYFETVVAVILNIHTQKIQEISGNLPDASPSYHGISSLSRR